jgi:hypothetical protein
MRCFPWIDAMCLGEGEHTIAPLARASAGLIPLDAVPGIMYRDSDGDLKFGPGAPPAELEKVPFQFSTISLTIWKN